MGSIKSDRVTLSYTRTGGRGMNKADLVNEVTKVTSTKKEAQAAVDCVFDVITNALKNNDHVIVVGFGTFKVADRKARMGRNLRTGEMVTIQARKVPRFTASKALRDSMEDTSD
jgi:nucleoid DNA-binding protein